MENIKNFVRLQCSIFRPVIASYNGQLVLSQFVIIVALYNIVAINNKPCRTCDKKAVGICYVTTVHRCY